MSATDGSRIDRRALIKWVAAASGALLAQGPDGAGVGVASAATASGAGYGPDPDLLRNYAPGDLWPLTLTTAQKQCLAALCDLIIPADEVSPGASAVGVPAFIDEWISAPYAWIQTPSNSVDADRRLVLDGLAWLDAQASPRGAAAFAALPAAAQNEVFELLTGDSNAAAALQSARRCYARVRTLTMLGFYTTPEGRKDLGIVGGFTPHATFEGPPPEALKALGL